MSLFKARERWTAAASHLGQDEEFDTGCMCIGNLDNDPSGEMKIATGSFQGVLRIFKPQQGEYGVEDLLYEQQYEDPILQLAAGEFSSNMPKAVVLAVLHSRRLVVYNTTVTPNPAAGQPPVQVNKLYEHPLDRPSSNFCSGPFGSAYGKQYVCVQSMDGLLSFFEQEVRTFCILRSDFLLPGPLAYNPKTDSFITASSTREIQAYQYTEMAAAASMGGANQDAGSSLTQFKKLQVSWSFSMGESVVDMQLGRVSPNLSPGQQDIIVLGLHTLLFLKDGGAVRAQKRMDYNPIAMTLYDLPEAAVSAGAGAQGMIISTASNSLLVYHGLTLMWAAKTESVPVCLSVGSFGGLNGLIATLDDTGHTSLLYLGTDPPTSSVVGTTQRELNYEKMDEEHRKLLDLIRDATSDQRQEPKDLVHLRASHTELLPNDTGGSIAQVRLSVSQAGTADIRDVSVAVSVPHGLSTAQDMMAVPRVAGTPISMILSFEAHSATAGALSAEATASYKNTKGEPRVTRCQIPLPLGLVARLVGETKEPTIMFTLHTDQQPVHLPTLYADLAPAGEDTSQMAANLVGFQYTNGQEVKLIASKNAGRYRVQGDSLASLCHLVLDFTQRLEQHHGGGVKIKFQEELPTKEFFDLIERHHTARFNLAATREVLAERASQFRAIEKRLLIRFKERNPAPMDNLDKLLEHTYSELIMLGEQHEQQQPELQELASQLTCGTQLFVMLLKFRFDLDEENYRALLCHFHCSSVDNFEQGWEERVNASLLYLLRTTMAKQGKASESALTTHNPALLEDVSRLQKHIQLVVDRLGKGLRPVAAAAAK